MKNGATEMKIIAHTKYGIFEGTDNGVKRLYSTQNRVL